MDWALAFLKSFRRWNSALALVMIPFDDNIKELQRRSGEYDFTIMDSPALAELDRLGASLTERPVTAKMFRKFTVFSGEFDTFIYFDSDVIVLDSLQPILDACAKISDCFVYYDEDMVMDWVYPDRAFADYMIATYNSVGFNAGAFAGRRGAINLERLPSIAKEAQAHRTQVWNDGWDQVFLNYVIDTCRVEKVPLSQLVGRATEAWPGRAFLKFNGNAADASRQLNGAMWVPFLHYAGFQINSRMPLKKLWLYYRIQGCTHDEEITAKRKLFKNTILQTRLYRKSKELMRRCR